FPSVIFLIFFFIMPLLVVLGNSFQSGEGLLSVQNYKNFFVDPYYLKVLVTTLRVSLLTTIITVIVGYMIAYYVSRTLKGKFSKRIAYIIIISPLFTSAVVRSFGWM